MKKHLKYCFFLAGILFGNFYYTGVCQGWDDGKTSGLMHEVRESIILHSDRTIYAAGEEVWFSANYFINGKEPEVLLSRVLYVELYNQFEETVFKGKFNLDEKGCRGSFQIPEETRSGVYFLRAYTAYMRNFAVEDFFIATITIVNPQLPPDLVSDQKKEIAVVTKNEGIEQWIKVTLKNGDTLLKKVPTNINPAFALKTSWEKENLVVEMSGKPPLESQLILFAYSAGYREMSSAKPKSITGNTTFVLPREKLAPGLNYLVLKDERQQIIRLLVVYNFQPITPEIPVKTDKSQYKTREKVEVNLDFEESMDNAEFTVCSVVVLKKGTCGFSRENTITMAHIENPILLSCFLLQGNYPGKPDDELIQAISMLQSSKLNIDAFNRSVQKNGHPTLEFLPEIRGLTISGKVSDKNTHSPLINSPIYSSVLFDNPQVNIYNTRSDGRFVLTMHEVTGLQDIYLCPAPESSGSPEIMVNQDFSATYPVLQPVAFAYDSTDADFLKELVFNARINSTYGTSVIAEKEKTKLSPVYFGNEKTVIYLDDYISLKSMKEVFTEIIPVVKVRKSGNKHRLIVTDDHANFLPGSPLLMVDNMPVFDADLMLAIHPSQVEKIEVINKVYVLGDRAINGIIMIYTKTDNFGGITRPSQSVFAEFQALTTEKDFKMPVYADEKTVKSPVPDFRNLVFWNPETVISGLENSIHFYTPDNQGDFEIIFRGIKPDGTQVSGYGFFSVAR